MTKQCETSPAKEGIKDNPMTEAPTLTRYEIEKMKNHPTGFKPSCFAELCDMALKYLDTPEVKSDAPVDAVDAGIEAANDYVSSLPKGQQAWDQKQYDIAKVSAAAALKYRAATPEPKAMRPAVECRCGQTATCELRPTNVEGAQFEPFCRSCADAEHGVCQEIADHEMRNFNGAYGVPSVEERPLTTDALQSKGCALPEWQPIETAPTDTWINRLLFPDASGCRTLGHYDVKNKRWYNHVDGDYFDPTHWIELPAAPQPPKE